MVLEQRRGQAFSKILSGLNQNQLKAVTSPVDTPLQIIAGPGTGKTSVLTARVLYLLLKAGQEPHHIIVTTFTKKAANEMAERLESLIPKDLGVDLSKLLIGTFHSICVRILKQNAHRMGLPASFKIADERDSKELLSKVLTSASKELLDLKSYMEELRKINREGDFDVDIFQENAEKHQGYDIDKIRRHISSFKSSGIESDQYSSLTSRSPELSHIYTEYQNKLVKASYLDFDDLLLYTSKLLKSHRCLPYVKHVLVDEFQDTNKIQLELMYLFSSQSTTNRDNVTIVGDPDQSIYAFRNAVSENFEYMRNHYRRNVEVIYLDQSYRSTNAVLKISEKLMEQEQETDRKLKNLRTLLDHDFDVINNRFDTNKDEAEFIAREISHLLLLPDLFKENDIAILLRSRFHSRVIEQSLRNHKIPYKVLQGRAFWELKEIQTMIDYLRCISLETDVLPFARVINVPSRGIGPKAVEQIMTLIDTQRDPTDSILNFLQEFSSSSKLLSNVARKGLANFVQVIAKAREILMENPENISECIDKMFDYLTIETNLIERTRPEDPLTTENNLKEFKREVLEFELVDRSLPDPTTGELTVEYNTTEFDALRFLSEFMESIDLYENDPDQADSKRFKVTLSTIHGAKGLEWPVVFIPSLTESYFPASWALNEDKTKRPTANVLKMSASAMLNEERRALYVAMTRAKTSLYLSGFRKKIFGKEEELQESRFLKGLLKHLKDSNQGLLSMECLRRFYTVNSKEFPEELKSKLKLVLSTYKEYHINEKEAGTTTLNPYSIKSQPVPKGSGFITTASSVYKSTKAVPIWQKPTLKRKSSVVAVSKYAPTAKKPSTTKKSFAPAYVYTRGQQSNRKT